MDKAPVHFITGTYEDLEAIPQPLRTEKKHTDDANGGFTDITPLTVLRYPSFGIVAEIVRVSYWIGPKADGTTAYDVHFHDLHPSPFAKDVPHHLTVESYVNPQASELEAFSVLLSDVRSFIAAQRLIDRQKGLHI